MTPVIREVETRDRRSILGIVNEAFSDAHHDGRSEVEIVERTWSLGAGLPGLDLVAEDEGHLVGHVLGGRADLGGRAVVGIAPLSVSPKRQRGRIGSSLVAELLRRAEVREWPLAVVLGDPAYYGRFGFELAHVYGISYRPGGIANPHFQARWLSELDASLHGDVRYCWEVRPS
jgi:putative acetyltransferase